MRHTAWPRSARAAFAAMILAATTAGTAAAATPSASDTQAKPWLGVYSQSLSSELREEFGYKGQGVLVNRVVPDSPADKAGLEKGDVIASLNSRAVDSPEALSNLVGEAKVGQSVTLKIVRDGKTQTLTAKLVARPEEEDEMVHIGPGHDDMEIEIPHDLGMRMPGMWHWMGRGRLGVRVESLNPDLGSYFGVPDGKGVLVVEVMKDTPAEKAGIKAGDVITKVKEQAVTAPDELVSALGDDEGKVALTTVRKGTKRTVQVELEKGDQVIRIRRGPGDRMQVREYRPNSDMQRQMDELQKQMDELKRQIEQMKKK